MSTPDFGNLRKYHVGDDTLAEYTFSQIEGDPSIWMAPATDANKGFQSERLRIAFEGSDEKAKKASEKLTPEMLTQQIIDDREEARVLLARCCAKAWGKAPVASDGTSPPFSEANCYAFLRALPDDWFDNFHNWASNNFNFRGDKILSLAEVEKLGNSSPKG